MAFQFVHLDWAGKGRTAARKKMGMTGIRRRYSRWSAKDLAAEAERSPAACPHVLAPKPPTILYGCTPGEAAERAEEWAAQARTANGRKYGKNQPCLASGVFTCPREMEHLWQDMRDSFVADLHAQYGDRFISAVEHQDEAHPHLHFYLVPRAGEEFGQVHPGYLARTKARADSKAGTLTLQPTPPGKKKRGVGYAVSAKFREAMKDWQDGIFMRVCSRFGFERAGPRRKRYAREEYIHNKREAAIAANSAQATFLRRTAEYEKLTTSVARRDAEQLQSDLKQHSQQVQDALKDLRATPHFQAIQVVQTERKARIKAEEALMTERQHHSDTKNDRDRLLTELSVLRASTKMSPN